VSGTKCLALFAVCMLKVQGHIGMHAKCGPVLHATAALSQQPQCGTHVAAATVWHTCTVQY